MFYGIYYDSYCTCQIDSVSCHKQHVMYSDLSSVRSWRCDKVSLWLKFQRPLERNIFRNIDHQVSSFMDGFILWFIVILFWVSQTNHTGFLECIVTFYISTILALWKMSYIHVPNALVMIGNKFTCMICSRWFDFMLFITVWWSCYWDMASQPWITLKVYWNDIREQFCFLVIPLLVHEATYKMCSFDPET